MATGRKCRNLILWGILGYFGYKIYRYITGLINISKELPVYLKNVIGEAPEMTLNVIFNRLTVILSFSKETLNEHTDLADMAKEYITRYYPIFRQDHITVQILEKEPESGADPEAEQETSEIPEKLEPESE